MQVNIEFELSGKKPLCVSISEEKRLVKITLFFYNVLGRQISSLMKCQIFY